MMYSLERGGGTKFNGNGSMVMEESLGLIFVLNESSEMQKFFLPLVFLVCLNVAAEQTFDASKLEAHQFTLGYVGFVGHISEAENYMEMVSKTSNAVKFFSAVIDDDSSTRVAKLYALCGMKKAGGVNFESYAEKVLKMGGKVSTMHGDQMQKEEISFFINRIKYHSCNK